MMDVRGWKMGKKDWKKKRIGRMVFIKVSPWFYRILYYGKELGTIWRGWSQMIGGFFWVYYKYEPSWYFGYDEIDDNLLKGIKNLILHRYFQEVGDYYCEKGWLIRPNYSDNSIYRFTNKAKELSIKFKISQKTTLH